MKYLSRAGVAVAWSAAVIFGALCALAFLKLAGCHA
jgi:hypothetical protein